MIAVLGFFHSGASYLTGLMDTEIDANAYLVAFTAQPILHLLPDFLCCSEPLA